MFISFVGSIQFCGLIEYVLLNIESGSWDLAYYHIPLITEFDWGNGPVDLIAIFELELHRQEALFCQEHPRYKSWSDLESIVFGFLGGVCFREQPSSLSRLKNLDLKIDDQGIGIASEMTTGGPLQALPGHLVVSQQSNLVTKVCSAFSGLSRDSLLRRSIYSLPLLPSDAIPTSISLLWSFAILEPGVTCRSVARARPLVQLPYGRVKNQRNFSESSCSFWLGLMEYTTNGPAEEYCLRSLEIAKSLPGYPHTEFLRQRCQIQVILILLEKGRKRGAEALSSEVGTRFLTNIAANGSGRWLKHLVLKNLVGPHDTSIYRYTPSTLCITT
ncbi:hypothetical protein GGR54DRAFT_453786 [Hypoxylon sp. NC1633]|nr:hypothetical protein GGR54DRAFT_453786 [Hypoxylon sp. NC1633]